MSLSETCSCGASFTVERNDELKLLNAWRTTHRCTSHDQGSLAMIDAAQISISDDFRVPELHIGFRPGEEDDE